MNSTSSFVTVPAASSYTLTITITITTLQCMREYQVLVEMHALFDTRHIEQRRTYTARITLVHVKALVLDILQYFCSFVLHGENRVTHNTQGEGECKQTPRQVSTKCSQAMHHSLMCFPLPLLRRTWSQGVWCLIISSFYLKCHTVHIHIHSVLLCISG